MFDLSKLNTVKYYLCLIILAAHIKIIVPKDPSPKSALILPGFMRFLEAAEGSFNFSCGIGAAVLGVIAFCLLIESVIGVLG